MKIQWVIGSFLGMCNEVNVEHKGEFYSTGSGSGTRKEGS